MPMPVRSLPVLQKWDCRGCTDCCREYAVHVTDEERTRIEGQGWADDPAVGGRVLFEKAKGGGMKLAHGPDGACVFLDEAGRCRIHAKFGPEAKPLACRVYPFVLVPVGDHWRVGLRFACPSAAEDFGRPLSAHQTDLQAYANALERRENVAARSADPPPLQAGQAVTWSDLFRFAQALRQLVRDRSAPLERRLRKCLALAALCRKARFDKVNGPRLGEFLEVVGNAIEAEVPADAAAVPPPSWVGRVLFRQAAALYARKDTGRHRGISARGRVALLGAAWRFARGAGRVPRVHSLMPETTFDAAE